MRTQLTKRVARPIDTSKIISRIIDELRDPWAIVVAESLTFFLYRADIELDRALAAGVSVLVVRVAVGLLLGTPPPVVRLTKDETSLAKHILCDGWTDAQVAVLLGVPEKSVGKLLKPILAKLRCANREELEFWAASVGFCSLPFHDRPEVRRILTIAALIGFGWTLLQILRTGCQFFGWCST